MLTPDYLEQFIAKQDGKATGRFRDIHLTSNFQPIYSVAHRRAVGYEALLRPFSVNGEPLSPLAVFKMAQNEAEHIFLDRLCRVIHTCNFLTQADATSWLFLNINPQVTVNGRRHGAFFSDVLQRCQIPPHRVVIEILEGRIHDEGLLADSVTFFKELGCLVAIDDFGAGHSNFDRIWRIQPHIVKLDRSIIAQAANNRAARRVLPNLVNLIHEAGSLVLMEGIETETEALITLDTDVDFVQGYYFTHPAESLSAAAHGQERLDGLNRKLYEAGKQATKAYRGRLHDYRDAFEIFARQFREGADAEEACRAFLCLPAAERCYLLDREGRQLGGNLLPASTSGFCDLRFRPLADSSNATWARRHYFRHAISQPGEIQVSRPYLSIAGSNMCVTLSAAVFSGKNIVVLCGDLTWDD